MVQTCNRKSFFLLAFPPPPTHPGDRWWRRGRWCARWGSAAPRWRWARPTCHHHHHHHHRYNDRLTSPGSWGRPWTGWGRSPGWRWWATPSWEHCSGTWAIFGIYWKTLCLDPRLTLLSGQVRGWNLCRGNRQWNLLSKESSENIIHLSSVYVCKNIISISISIHPHLWRPLQSTWPQSRYQHPTATLASGPVCSLDPATFLSLAPHIGYLLSEHLLRTCGTPRPWTWWYFLISFYCITTLLMN